MAAAVYFNGDHYRTAIREFDTCVHVARACIDCHQDFILLICTSYIRPISHETCYVGVRRVESNPYYVVNCFYSLSQPLFLGYRSLSILNLAIVLLQS